MSKELVISANRHETRVAIVEDDQVVEVYHQRENEYSLAGSIHKGRVTRVLPGMQSAFVDIGLDRDAFLYVSDFFEDNEEYDKIVTRVEEKVLKLDRSPQPAPAPAQAVAAAPDSHRSRSSFHWGGGSARGNRACGSRSASPRRCARCRAVHGPAPRRSRRPGPSRPPAPRSQGRRRVVCRSRSSIHPVKGVRRNRKRLPWKRGGRADNTWSRPYSLGAPRATRGAPVQPPPAASRRRFLCVARRVSGQVYASRRRGKPELRGT